MLSQTDVSQRRAQTRALIAGGLLITTLCANRTAIFGQTSSDAERVRSDFTIFEKSIVDLQEALERRQVTSRQLVANYLARIEAYDETGPAINAFITINPRALDEADTLDRERASRRLRGPLHGIPIAIKDNFETAGMPTTGSSIALATWRPSADAFQVARLRAAGAIVLGKTNLHELASGIVTVSSLGGQTRNPYDPRRNPGGSSGGTGAAIAASFAAGGLGTDTCGSIRIPAAHNGLVGLRPTMGLSSRAGVIPLSHTQDVAGPLARTVKDLALLLDATAGVDPRDATTHASRDRIPPSYTAGLDRSTLKGLRIGVLSSLFGDAPEDTEVADIVRHAISRMASAGAIVTEIAVPGLTELLRGTSVIDAEFKFDLADYLAAIPNPPVSSLGEILERGLYHQALEGSFRRRNAVASRDSDAYRATLARREETRKAVLAAMDKEKVAVLVYPTVRRKASLIGESQAGSNCQLSPTTGLPALSVPAGFTDDGLPIGMELLGRAFSEPEVLRIAAAFERMARLRRPPASTPALPRERSETTGAPASDRDPPARFLGPPDRREPALESRFDWQPDRGVLGFDVAVEGVSPGDMLLVALHRADQDKTGPVIARLVRMGQTTGQGEVVLSAPQREDLRSGRLYVQLYTRRHPFGTARSTVRHSALGTRHWVDVARSFSSAFNLPPVACSTVLQRSTTPSR